MALVFKETVQAQLFPKVENIVSLHPDENPILHLKSQNVQVKCHMLDVVVLACFLQTVGSVWWNLCAHSVSFTSAGQR